MPKTGFSSEDELQDRALQRVERMDVEVVRDVRNRIATTETGLASLERLLRVEEVLSRLLDSLCPESNEAQAAGVKDELRGMERLKELEGF